MPQRKLRIEQGKRKIENGVFTATPTTRKEPNDYLHLTKYCFIKCQIEHIFFYKLR